MLLSAQGVFILFFDEAKGKSEGTAGFFNIFSIVLCFIQKGRASPGPCFSRGAVVLLFLKILSNLFALFPSLFQAALVQAGRRGGGRRRQRGDEHQDAPHVRPWRARRGEQPLDCLSIFQTFTILD